MTGNEMNLGNISCHSISARQRMALRRAFFMLQLVARFRPGRNDSPELIIYAGFICRERLGNPPFYHVGRLMIR